MAIDTQPVLTECFGGGTSGSAIPASAGGGLYASLGTADGMLFDSVTIGSGQAMTYDNTVAHSGTMSCKIVTGSGNSCFGLWESSGLLVNTAAQQWFRLYLYHTANPSAAHQVFGAFVAGTRAADLVVNSNGTLSMRNAAGTVVVTTTNAVPLSQWYRVEGYVVSSATAGQVSVSLYSSPDSTTPAETQTSGATQNTTGGSLSQMRFGAASGAVSGLTWWMDDVAASVSGPVGPGAIVQQMVCGAPASAGFTVISKPVGGTSLRLKVATNAGLTTGVQYVSAVTPDQYGYVRHVVTGLAPFTRYWCQLLDTPAGGSEAAVGNVGTCKTLQAAGVPQSFTFAVASCVNTADETPGPDTGLDDWIAWQADLNIFTGDYNYENPVYTDQPSQLGTWEAQTWFYGMEPVTRQAWGYYCRSNHDSTADADYCDSDNLWTAANIQAAQEAFPQGVLGDTVNSPVHGLFQAWVQGRVRFIMLDIRNIDRSPGMNADNSSKTMLGPAQLAWLYAQLIQPEPLKIIVTDTQWLGSVVPTIGQDDELGKWWSYQTERAAIVSYMLANWSRMKNVLLIHGDFHGVAEATAWENATGGFPVFAAAPLRQTGAATTEPGTFDRYYNNSGGECRQYGRVTVTDSGQAITVNYQGWDAVGQVAQVQQTFTANVSCGFRPLAGVL
jgi:hypothetical protein